MWWIPALNEKFVIVDNKGNLLRAERLPISDLDLDPFVYMKLFLLDTGESFIISAQEISQISSTFEMPTELKKVPGLAVRSEFINIDIDHDYENDGEFIQNNLYRKFTFEVVEKTVEVLKVNIFPYYANQDANDVKEVLVGEGDLISLSNIGIEKKSLDLESKAISPCSNVNTKVTLEMTQKEIEIFFEEPHVTYDSLIAVQGFKTHDDDRVCKFYDEKTGGCFKGVRCKQRHMRAIEDGTCTDSTEIYFENIQESLPSPSLNAKVNIEITHFKDATNFFCRYWKLKPKSDQITIEKLLKQMNDPTEVAKYKLLIVFPSNKQLVIVKANGTFYRGRVEDTFGNECSVLLVDLGVMESFEIETLYEWSPRFNYLPFQTIEMQIANIQPLNGDFGEAAIDRIMIEVEESQKKYLKALIHENVGIIKCSLFNYDNEDIGKKLVDEGFAEAKDVSSATPKAADYFIPG